MPALWVPCQRTQEYGPCIRCFPISARGAIDRFLLPALVLARWCLRGHERSAISAREAENWHNGDKLCGDAEMCWVLKEPNLSAVPATALAMLRKYAEESGRFWLRAHITSGFPRFLPVPAQP